MDNEGRAFLWGLFTGLLVCIIVGVLSYSVGNTDGKRDIAERLSVVEGCELSSRYDKQLEIVARDNGTGKLRVFKMTLKEVEATPENSK